MRSSPWFLCTVLSLSLFAGPASAQRHPNQERGFAPESTFQSGDLDHVNLFNGNLVLQLPLGPGYPVNGGFSYQLVLTYNSNLWDFFDRVDAGQPGVPAPMGVPTRRTNAGPGWNLSFGNGRLIGPNQTTVNEARFNEYLFIDSDGSEQLVDEFPADVPVFVPSDGRYQRFRRGATLDIERPDGVIESYGGAGFLASLKDRHNNTVTITPKPTGEDLPYWQITDGHREHRIYFDVPANSFELPWGRVRRVELATFGGGPRAVYHFQYTQVTLPRHPLDQATSPPLGSTERGLTVQLLTAIQLPDNSFYNFTYQTNSLHVPGVIQSLSLPTGGRFEWDFDHVFLASNEPLDPQDPSPEPPPLTTVFGVVERRVFRTPGSSAFERWLYTREGDNFPSVSQAESRVIVTSPEGDDTVNYFNTWWNAWDYGLPYTRRLVDPAHGTRFLSQEIYDGSRSNPANKRRSVYRRYEADDPGLVLISFGAPRDFNNREASVLTTYADDGNFFTVVDRSNFDGLGHYREETVGGNFIDGRTRTLFTNFNWNNGRYDFDIETGLYRPGHNFNPPADSAAWLLGTFNRREVQQGTTTLVSTYCFDTNKGDLLRERRHLNGSGNPAAKDVVVDYEVNAVGNVRHERYYGSQQNLPTGSNLCAITLAGEQFDIEHEYSFGALRRSRYLGDAGDLTLGYYSYDADIDAATGLAATTRDSTGVPTGYEYDSLARLVWVKPGQGTSTAISLPTLGAWTEYCYTQRGLATACASGSPAPAPPALPSGGRSNVFVRQRSGSKTGTVLSEGRVAVDGLGRVEWRYQRQPSGAWTRQVSDYNSRGWMLYQSNWGDENFGTTYMNHDPFGRPGRIRPADSVGPAFLHDVTLGYTGVRRSSRTIKRASDPLQEQSSTTTEVYDLQGRLWKLIEPSNGTSKNPDMETQYSYDPADRLTRVLTSPSANPGQTQERVFTYNGLGFLTSESHPELDNAIANCLGQNGTTCDIEYTGYDAMGHLRSKRDGRFSLSFLYDRAGRPLEVRDTVSDKVLKSFSYGIGNGGGDWSWGKMSRGSRFREVVIGGVNRSTELKQSFTYGGRDGRMSFRRMEFPVDGVPGDVFDQTFSYDALGNESQIDYPRCVHLACTQWNPHTPRVVPQTFSYGVLTAVPGYATQITYHANQTVNQVQHANSITWSQGIDPHFLPRPASISMSTGATLGAYTWDGAGNVKTIGGEKYLYDPVGRITRGELSTGDFQAYGYDVFGNLVEIGSNLGAHTRKIGANAATNRLAGATIYDTSGNMTSWNGLQYGYDAFNLLDRRVANGEEWLFFYDAFGERVLEFRPPANNVPRFDRWSLRGLGNQVLRVYEATGYQNWSAVKDYIYRGSILLAVENRGAGVRHFHPDHLGTPRLITDGTGATVAIHHYFPYGEEVFGTADDERMKFTGHERDPNAAGTATDDLDYMHARFYHPAIGRFLSVDSARGQRRAPITFNRYQYARNNPLGFIDPDGRAEVGAVPTIVVRLNIVFSQADKSWSHRPTLREVTHSGLMAARNYFARAGIAFQVRTYEGDLSTAPPKLSGTVVTSQGKQDANAFMASNKGALNVIVSGDSPISGGTRGVGGPTLIGVSSDKATLTDELAHALGNVIGTTRNTLTNTYTDLTTDSNELLLWLTGAISPEAVETYRGVAGAMGCQAISSPECGRVAQTNSDLE